MDQRNLSVKQFCQRYNISASTFYRLRKSGEGPEIAKVRSRTLIPIEVAEHWNNARLQRNDGARND